MYGGNSHYLCTIEVKSSNLNDKINYKLKEDYIGISYQMQLFRYKKINSCK